MHKFPAWHPDINVFEGDPPISWDVTVRRNGAPLDLTDLTIDAPVYHLGTVIGSLGTAVSNALSGIVTLTLTQELFALTGSMSTWFLREETQFDCPLIRGRIVRGG
jgi:hypothetical protein